MASGDVKFELETDGLEIEYEGPEAFARDHLVGVVYGLVGAVQRLQAAGAKAADERAAPVELAPQEPEPVETETEAEIVEAEHAPTDGADVIALDAEDDVRQSSYGG